MKVVAVLCCSAVALAGCGAAAGAPQPGGNSAIGIRALVRGCKPHGGVKAYSFRYQSSKYLWTALCEDDTPVVVGGD